MLTLCNRCCHKFKLTVHHKFRQLPHAFGVIVAASAEKHTAADMPPIDTNRIRNFSIIAHVDHGKSTLSDRLLEFTGTISRQQQNKQVLDKLKIERERGITVKAQTAALLFTAADGETHLLNLIDTPGHSDFSHEVQRSLAASDGVLLLVDANDGVQAQTIANFYSAMAKELPVLPVVNKIDLPKADPQAVCQQLHTLFGFELDEILQVSAKHGTGINELLQAIVNRLPPPTVQPNSPLSCLIIDSWFEPYRGAVSLIAVTAGCLAAGDTFYSQLLGTKHSVKEVGVFRPGAVAVAELPAGWVGYVVSTMRSVGEAVVGDRLVSELLEGSVGVQAFQTAQPMVYCGLFPASQSEIATLEVSLNKLTLNDASVSVSPDSHSAFGRGWRLGFLGLLHMDVFRQRLEEEFNLDVIVTTPSIPYRVQVSPGGDIATVTSAASLPQRVEECWEPLCSCTVITPVQFLETVTELLLNRRAKINQQSYIDSHRLLIECEAPLSEIVIDLVEILKIRTSGMASFHYEESGWRSVQLVQLVPFVNDSPVEELAMLLPRERARQRAEMLAERLAAELPRQQFLIKIQLRVGGQVLASSSVKPFRKDVTQKIKSGTDRTRRQKLLASQREGKRRMRMVGQVAIPRDTFIKVLKS